MAIESVSSSISAYTSASVQPNQARPDNQAVERAEPKAAERVEKVEEQARPVTNALGQQTGTLINVTA